MFCSYKGPVWLLEPMSNGSELPVTIAPWDLPTSSGFHEQLHTLGVYSHRFAHTHINKIYTKYRIIKCLVNLV